MPGPAAGRGHFQKGDRTARQRQLYRACYALLTVTALKLLWDGLRG